MLTDEGRLQIVRSSAPRMRLQRIVAAVVLVLTAIVAPIAVAAPAQAADPQCSTSASASACYIGTSTTVTGGGIGVRAPGTLFWNFNQAGYNQVESGSAAALTGCGAAAGGATTCAAGVAPVLQVVDASGAAAGWALSAYMSNVGALPSGTTLKFNGAGTTIGSSTTATAIGAAAPATVCDAGSTCTAPTAATTCNTPPKNLGFSACPSYGVELTSATSTTSQVDLYSAAAGTGTGAMCFASGTATSAGCVGTTSKAFFNMTLSGQAPTGTYTTPIITLTATSGP